MTNPTPGRFSYRELEAGPRRDIARAFHELMSDNFSWLKDGPEKEEALEKLADARDAAVKCAETMLRS
jgi:hypothetical protein